MEARHDDPRRHRHNARAHDEDGGVGLRRLLTHRVLLLFHTQLGRRFGSSGFAAVADPMVAD
jgi:hypothetical protein